MGSQGPVNNNIIKLLVKICSNEWCLIAGLELVLTKSKISSIDYISVKGPWGAEMIYSVDIFYGRVL